ncbi:MAG: 13E12 repeat family protein, partial [Cryobacterium sp.]|nr:13E12 repeat family protein [Cryobacterium sp.]
MSTSAASTTGHLTGLRRERARAESDELDAMLRYRDAEMARTEDVRPMLRRQIERSAIALEIGQALGMSEGQVHHRLAAAQRVREHTPFVWIAFRAGRIDLARVREISQAVDTLERPESHLRLDQTAAAYAETHTVPELKRWLRRFVERVEADLALERAERAREQRRVEVFHGDDGMAVLYALLPSHVAAAIERRLAHEAKALDADDDRTVPQRKADLLAAWATCTESGEAAVHAQIAVKLPADSLTGATDGFAEAADGSWSAPASWILDPSLISNPVWHRLIVDPVTHD